MEKAPWTAHELKMINVAQKLAKTSQPIEGTLAETYLREYRGITCPTLPVSFRFHPGIYSTINEATHPALLVIAKDIEDNVQSVQAIFLDENTANKNTAVEVSKQTFGPIQGTTVNISSEINQFTAYAEGPETGLSIANALPEANVKILLGKSNFGHISHIDNTRPILLCFDNDGQSFQNDKMLKKVVEHLDGICDDLRIAMPATTKTDFNDLLKTKGATAVRDTLLAAPTYKSGIESDTKTNSKPSIIADLSSS